MKKIYIMFFFLLSLVGFSGCNHNSAKTEYSGVYIDEYGNRFTLNENHTGTILFVNSEKVNNIMWNEEKKYGIQCATISYNGNPEYYYLRKGYLFLHKEDMLNHICPISVTKLNE